MPAPNPSLMSLYQVLSFPSLFVVNIFIDLPLASRPDPTTWKCNEDYEGWRGRRQFYDIIKPSSLMRAKKAYSHGRTTHPKKPLCLDCQVLECYLCKVHFTNISDLKALAQLSFREFSCTNNVWKWCILTKVVRSHSTAICFCTWQDMWNMYVDIEHHILQARWV